MRAPRYGSHSLVEVLPSVAAALGVEPFGASFALPALSQAVVVVVDGLGQLQLLEAASHAPAMAEAASETAAIDAAFPTTTPAGLASLTLALAPGLHGLVGATFELPDFDCVLNPLHWQDDPPPVAVQAEPNAFARMHGLRIRSHGPTEYASSGMTRTLLGNAEQCGYTTFDPRVIEEREGSLDYVYLPQLDKAGHGHGPHTEPWNTCLAGIERVVRDIRKRLPDSAGVIVTADHGMVSVPDALRIDADQPLLQAGVRRMAGEPRMRHLYTEHAVEVASRWQQLLGDAAHVLLRDDAITQGLFGETDEFMAERIGDVIVIAEGRHAFVSKVVDPKPSGLRGLHGALTDEELLVPCLLLRGVA